MSERDVVMMARVRNEERWIARNLERTLLVAGTVVLWDDGSTDNTEILAREAIKNWSIDNSEGGSIKSRGTPMGWITSFELGGNIKREIHFLHSPFRYGAPAREKEAVNEIRDKNLVWYYLKAQVKFRHVLCLDGDEMLSHEAVRGFPNAIKFLESGVDMIDLPFIYLWDGEEQQRVDALYGNAPDGGKRLRFPRLFTIDRVDPQQLFDMHFAWGGGRGGFHCGSVPQQDFLPGGMKPSTEDDTRAFLNLPVVHFGYIDDPLRERKFKFYNEIDPDNEAEGRYLHIIGESNIHTPGRPELAPWKDV